MTETGRATAELLRTITRQMLAFLGGLVVLGTVGGWLAGGAAGVWGALLATAIAAFFLLTTVLVMRATAQATLPLASAALLGGWLVKVVVLFGVLWLVRDSAAYHRGVFLVALLAAVTGVLIIEMRAVLRARIPVVEPGEPGASRQPPRA